MQDPDLDLASVSPENPGGAKPSTGNLDDAGPLIGKSEHVSKTTQQHETTTYEVYPIISGVEPSKKPVRPLENGENGENGKTVQDQEPCTCGGHSCRSETTVPKLSEKPFDSGEHNSRGVQDQETTTPQACSYTSGTAPTGKSGSAKTATHEVLRKTLHEEFQKDRTVPNKDTTKEVGREEPPGSSTSWKENMVSKIWESDKDKIKRLQNENTNLQTQLTTKNTEMQQQKREHTSTSSKHDKLKREYSNLREDYGKLSYKHKNLLEDIRHERSENSTLRNEKSLMDSTYNKLKIDYKKLSDENSTLEKDAARFKGELEEERRYIEELKARINEREEEIAKGHADTVKKLTANVSSTVADNQMAGELTSFFADCYEDWAMENCVRHLKDTNRIETELLQSRLLRCDPSMPQELRFNFSDPTAAAIVLQTYLSQALREVFFDNPYFLIALAGEKEIKDETSDGRGLIRIEHWQGENGQDGLEWRANTVERLERMYQLREIPFRAMAVGFCSTYSHLLESQNENVVRELEIIFSDCARMALKIWKAKKDIRVYGLDQFVGDPRRCNFRSTSPETKPDHAVGLAVRDSSLDGRPICMVVTPLIYAYFRHARGKAPEQVVWSKATVWTSNKNLAAPQYW